MTASLPSLEMVQHWASDSILESILHQVETSEDWLKLPRHIRSRARRQQSGPYLYVKGWEPLAGNYSGLLASLGRRPYRGSEITFLQHFSHKEKKVPAVLRLTEAVEEAQVAAYLQSQAITILGRSLDLPVPLGLFKFSSVAKGQLWQELRPALDEEGIAQCEEILAQDDPAVYFYEQASPPHRLEDYLNRSSWPVLQESYPGTFVAESAMREWLHLFLFFLRVDVLAFHEASIGLGSPFDVGNLCLSGGVADVGTCLMQASQQSPEYIRVGLEMASDSFLVIYGHLLKRDALETRDYLLHLIDELCAEHAYLHNVHLAVFKTCLKQQASLL